MLGSGVSDPDPVWIRIQLGSVDPDPGRQTLAKKETRTIR
jgi:hypothetical protein